MGEVTPRKRILATLHGDHVDRLPFFHWWRHSQIGWAERECRNRGMGMCWLRPCHIMTMENVERTEAQDTSTGRVIQRRVYHTPVGSLYLDEKREPGVEEWHGLRSWRDVSPWQIDRLIKKPEDYKVLKYMIDHTTYTPYYFPIEQAEEWLGSDGLVIASLPHTPMQMLMIDWIGSEGGRFFIHHAKYRDEIEELYEALCKSREPLYEIAARSPAEVVMCGDNIDGLLVNPRLFEKYFMPVYEKCAAILHEQGKLMAVHMDGRINVLKDLVAKTPIDIVEALHPPPMGDLPLSDALSRWQQKVIWMGYPGSVYTLGPEAVKKHALTLLRSIVPGDRLCVEMSTENLVSNENLLTLTSILENATLPLTKKTIDRIERSVT